MMRIRLGVYLYAIVVILCVFIALNLFELAKSLDVPPGDDSRAHIYRISGFLSEYVLNMGFSLRQYNGMILLNYAPLFYAVAQLFSYLVGPIHSYNICRALTLALYTASLLLLAAKSGIDRRRLLPLIPVATFFPTLWIAYYKGAFPYILSWSFTVISAALILSYSSSQRTEYMVLSAVAGGLSILSHSYGLVNIVFPVTLLLITTARRSWRKSILLALAYMAIALSISSGYLLSVLITYKDSSPLHEVSPLAWVPGLYIESLGIDIIVLATLVASLAVLIHMLISSDTRRGNFVVFWGLFLYTSIALLLIMLNNIKLSEPVLIREVTSFIMPWRFLLINNATFISMYIGNSKYMASISARKPNMLIFITSLLIVGTIASIVVTSTVAPYEKPIDEAFPGFTNIVKGSRVLVVGTPLVLPNSPVTFSILYNYTTSTGSYNQGDPTFFDLTVYYEWMNSLLTNPVTLSNTIELSQSKYIFTDLNIPVELVHINATSYSCRHSKNQNNSEVLECVFDSIIEFNEFSGIKIELTNYSSNFVRASAILTNGSEIELEPIEKIVNPVKTSFVLQPHCQNRCRYNVHGIKLYMQNNNDVLGIELGALNLRKVATYEYRGYRFNLYEYNGNPSPAICSKIIVFDTKEFNPKLLNLMADNGNKAIIVEGMQNIPKELIAGIVTDDPEKAAEYLKEGYRTILLTKGSKFSINKIDTNFAQVDTTLLGTQILPYDPGNPWTYLKWDRSISHDELADIVDEASKLWDFIARYTNIAIKPCNASIKFNPPELYVEPYKDTACLVKIAYTSHWITNTQIWRSATGFLVVAPSNNTSLIRIVWNPPYVSIGYKITAISTSIALSYICINSLKRRSTSQLKT
ncbi:MAG: hypothetical protein QW320_03905 [Ignisphaera sp.]